MMKKFLLLLLTSCWILANSLPQRIETTIKSIDKNGNIQLSTSVPVGMSGIVVHSYGNGLSAITHSLTTQQNSLVKVQPYTAILHENIPTVKTDVKVNDRVILGAFYDNAMLIAPDARTYATITKNFKKTWIHPDAYALEFMGQGESAISTKSLEKFAQANQIGLVLIVDQNKILILDPISQLFLGELPLNIKAEKTVNPFFSRFEQVDVSTFGFSKVQLVDYYQAIKNIQ
jgi:hypothetical protein